MATSYNPQPVGLGRLQLAAVLRDAREPVLIPQGLVFAGALNGPPASRAVGVDVQPFGGAMRAGVGIMLQADPAKRRGLYRVDNNDGATYGLRFGEVADAASFAVTAAAGGDAAATAAAVLAALEGSAAFAAIGGEAELVEEDGTVILFAVSSSFRDRIWTGTAAGASLDDNGSAAVEATFVRWRLWMLAKGRGAGTVDDDRRWIVAKTIFDSRLFTLEEVSVAGVDRVYVEVTEADGFVIPIIAPAPREEFAAQLRDSAAEAFAAAETSLQAFSTAYKGSSVAAEVVAQGRVDVLNTSTEILPVRPDRRGFLLRNEGATTIQLRWRAAGDAAATSTSLSLAAGEIRAQEGPNCPKGALDGLSDASEPVWREEW